MKTEQALRYIPYKEPTTSKSKTLYALCYKIILRGYVQSTMQGVNAFCFSSFQTLNSKFRFIYGVIYGNSIVVKIRKD